MRKFSIKFLKTVLALLPALFVVLYFSACSEDDVLPPKSSEKAMSDFNISAGGDIFSATLQSDGKTFHFMVPFAFSQDPAKMNQLKTATPTFKISTGATANPASGQSQDFTQDVTYTVTAEDESTAVYTVHRVEGTSSEAAFLSFSLYVGTETDLVGVIDDANSTVYFPRLPEDLQENLKDAVPTFTLSMGATANPATGVKQDFSEPVEYVVTAHDGTTKRTWTVMQHNRTDADIVAFYLDLWEGTQGAPGTEAGHNGDLRIIADIDKETRTITYELPMLPAWFIPAKMTVFPAVIQLSEGWSGCEPMWDVPQDFSKDVKYTITAEDGVTKMEWTVKAPKNYMQEKWYVDYKTYTGGAHDQNPNSIALVGDYLVVSRQLMLINKSDGTVAAGTLNNTGLDVDFNNEANPWPFFVTNDDAGHLIGGTLNAWNNNAFTLVKWTNATTAPEKLMVFPTKVDDIVTCGFGRKFQVVGDITGKGLIIASNIAGAADEVLWDQGEHYVWKITGGVVDTNNPDKLKTNIRMHNYGYQLLTPLGTDPVAPWYVGSHTTKRGDENLYANLQFGALGDMDMVQGPFDLGEASANGWGNHMWLYQKVFTFDGMNMIATLSSSYADYCFALMERKADGTHVPFATTTLEWNSTDFTNGNGSGSFTMEKIGNDIFFYLLPTNKGIACYRLGKF